MSGLHRRDTSLSGGDPSSKIWGLYLSQAAKVDKEHSDIWIGNTDSVLVFVRHELLYTTRLYCSHLDALIRPVFSPRWWLHFLLSAIRCYSPIRPIPTISCLPKSPGRQMGQARHSCCLLPTIRLSKSPLLPCV